VSGHVQRRCGGRRQIPETGNLISTACLSLASASRPSHDEFRLSPIGPDHLAVGFNRSPKICFFAKRTQSCSMFTGKIEKITACETHQNRYKTAQNGYETHSTEVKITRKTPPNDTFYRSQARYGKRAAPGSNNWSGSASGQFGSDRATTSGGVASRILTPNFYLLTSVLTKIFFPKNEAKLCPSLLAIVKKRTQKEPK
jgi:hypothetical protein